MRFPSIGSHVERAIRLSLSIARTSRRTPVIEAAMKLVRALELFKHERPPLEADERVLQQAISRLRTALQSGRNKNGA